MSSARIDVGFVCLLLLAFTNTLAGNINVCSYAKQRGYFAADCSNSNLWDFPPLQSDIEALDVSSNRLQGLTNDTFKCCTSIKFLYLQVNQIGTIEENAFQPLTELNVLDLSWNAFDELPKALPQTLRRLYLDGIFRLFNKPSHSNELNIAHLKNLEYLSIGNCKMKKFPSFGGSIPSLLELNVTNNLFETMTDDDLAPLCQLKFLHVKPDSLFPTKDHLCDCVKFENWTNAHNIQVSPFTCKYDYEDKAEALKNCTLRPSNATLAKREACLIELKNRQIPLWLMIGGGILAAIMCVCILVYVRYRRRQRESSAKNGHDRNAAIKYDNKGDENGVNPAFNGYGGGRGVETTV